MKTRLPKGLVITRERYRENYFDNSNKGESRWLMCAAVPAVLDKLCLSAIVTVDKGRHLSEPVSQTWFG